MAKKDQSYQDLSAELDNILVELQQDDLDVDRAIACYERGLELVNTLEAYLKNADNRIKDLKAKFSEQ